MVAQWASRQIVKIGSEFRGLGDPNLAALRRPQSSGSFGGGDARVVVVGRDHHLGCKRERGQGQTPATSGSFPA